MPYLWQTDGTLASLADKSDEEAAAAIQAMTVTSPKDEAFITERSFSVIPGLGPVGGQILVDKLEAVFAAGASTEQTEAGIRSRLIVRHIGYMRDAGAVGQPFPGIDVSKAEVRAFLPALVGVGSITQAEIDALLAFGLMTPQRKYPEPSTIFPYHISAARRGEF